MNKSVQITIVSAIFVFAVFVVIIVVGPDNLKSITVKPFEFTMEMRPPINDYVGKDVNVPLASQGQKCPEGQFVQGFEQNGTIICNLGIPTSSTNNTSSELLASFPISYLNEIGLELYSNQEFDKANTVFDIALEKDPKYKVILNNKGIILKNLGNYTGAITYYDLALNQDENYTNALVNKANIFLVQHKGEDALPLLEKILENDPENIPVLLGKAYTLVNTGSLAKAKNTFEKVLKIEPNNVDALHGLAITFTNMGFYGPALEFFDKALLLEPSNQLIMEQKNSLEDYVKTLPESEKWRLDPPQLNITFGPVGTNPNLEP